MSTGGHATDQTAAGASPGGGTGPAGPERGPRGVLPMAAKAGHRLATASASWTLLALVILMVVFSVWAPGRFLTGTDLSLIATNAATLLIMAVGETFVIVTAGIDLSVGMVLVLSGVVAGDYYMHNGSANAGWGVIVIGAVIGLAVGGGFGALQGFVVAKGKVPPLIVTLGGFGVAQGLAYLITGGSDLRTVPTRLVDTIGFGSVGGLRWIIIIAFVIAIVFGLVLAYTRFGRYTYAIGSNPEAARRAGINVPRHLIKVYGLQGLLSGAAGVISLGFLETTGIASHPTDNLTVITAVVLGGASLFGGRGTMIGTVIGLFIPAVLQTGLVIKSVNPYWQYVAIGLILVAAVYLDQFRRRLRERA
jgi:ribose transport system permease protein